MSIKNEKLSYILLGFAFWFIVDWGTAGGFQPSYFTPLSKFILLVIIYISSVLILTYAIFKRRWSENKLFILTLLLAFIIEVPVSKNPLVYKFPLFFIGIPLAICIYSVVTYFPLWIIRNEVGANKKKMILLSIVLAIVTILSIINQNK